MTIYYLLFTIDYLLLEKNEGFWIKAKIGELEGKNWPERNGKIKIQKEIFKDPDSLECCV